MKLQITKDLLSGALFLLIGLGTIIIAQGYRLGTAANMGPGYFPIMLGSIVALIGAVMLVKAARNPETSEIIQTWEFRPLVFLTAAILLFSALIDTRGAIAGVVVLILVGRLAGREGSMLELAIMVLALTAAAIGIFVYGLNIPLRLRPW
ncbi:membrane protein [Agaricicola taiwanensis]|uniref:Membrane protein n=1 Tax=Agaricicola taiwanensis TaxID=591372 RepID=A0A8J2YM65_9RHOB|nr:tripartite tricarboxylate transporter TctB family protein [Agaricicola taiwanensis]GGE51546.1 membrane protein [Agaricicola taiwanensis]